MTHAALLVKFGTNFVIINKLVGSLLQVIGGLLVLYSVNDNLGLFRAQSFASAIVDWLRDFPLDRKQVVVEATSAGAITVGGSVAGSYVIRGASLEERILELERMYGSIQSELRAEVQGMNTKVESVQSKLMNEIGTASGKVDELSNKLDRAAVGGFKIQAFGVLLAIYGAVTNVFA